MASIHQKTKTGVWYISYLQEGKLRHRSLGTRIHSEAKRLKKEIELKTETSPEAEFVVIKRPKTITKNPLVEEFWQEFMKWAIKYRTRSTIEEYTVWFRQFTEFTQIERLGDVTLDKIRAFKDKLEAQGKRKPEGVGLSNQSINSALRTLRTIWNHARKQELYSGDNPFSAIERFEIPERPPREYLGKEKVDALLNAAEQYATKSDSRTIESRNVYLAFALMALAGLRKREVCFARWEWVKWGFKLLVVSNHEEFTTKNKRNRTISMNEDLLQILGAFRKNEGYILEATRTNRGKCRYRADFKKAFRQVCQMAGVTATPHALRHSFASRHAVAGTSLHVIAGWLGHSTTSVTERYAHFQTGYNKAANNI